MARIAKDVLELVGKTPLVHINRLASGLGAEVIAKVESANPGFCVKDRIAKAMIDDALAAGTLKPGMTVIEPTSGNTGIGLAMACAVRGIPCILVMPDTMSAERRQILKVFGAKLELTPGALGMAGAVSRAEAMLAEVANSWMPQQFKNPSNPKIHRDTTAEEIWNDTDGSIDVLVAGVGTGGTVTGCGEVLKARKPGVKIIAVEPSASPLLSQGIAGRHKIQGIGANFVPEVLNRSVIDEVIAVSDDEAGDIARRLALEEGLFCGISCGAAMAAALKVAARPEMSGKKIVVILPDTGERYLSTWLFESYKA
ncbi:MAG: hypothetical protein RL095_3860 [Verrucomicrobiota bacterium]|jgi:cysteine synthase A